MSLIKANLRSSLPMESVVALIAEWIPLAGMIKLQEPSALISDNLKEWQEVEALDLIGNQVWENMTEEWAEYMYGEGNCRAF